ncbi:hypothetical protein CMMCAS06_09325 [Clavibacter michiganensis subsp. michiganensis]|nr:hypothetical protein CMMCAS06_09325 [Clavibacter michiganensis subsp. michiganensis]
MRPARAAPESPATAIAVAATDAPAAVAACQDTRSPTNTAAMPSAAASAIRVGIRVVQCPAATAGASSRPTTSRDPTAWYDATTARVTRPTSAACAERGPRPSTAAMRGSSASATSGRWKAHATARPTTAAPASRAMSTGAMARMSPKRIAVASVAKLPEWEITTTPRASIATNSRPMLVS